MENKNQLQRQRQQLSIQKSEKTLDLAKTIVAKKESLPFIEMKLKINDTFNKPTMRSVFKGELGSISYTVVNALCHRFINSFAFSNKISDDAIESFAIETLERFEYETLEDVILFFKMARNGKFGNAKRSVDSNFVYSEWYPKYLDYKSEEREKEYLNKKSEQKTINDGMSLVEKTYSEMIDKKTVELKKQKDKIFINNTVANFDKQMLEDTITQWSKDPKMDKYTKMLKEKRKYIK